MITEINVTKHYTFHTNFSEFPRDESFANCTLWKKIDSTSKTEQVS